MSRTECDKPEYKENAQATSEKNNQTEGLEKIVGL